MSDDPNRHTSLAQLNGTPKRRYFRGTNLARALTIEDLRAITHQRMPRFVLEYLESGAEDEATLERERTAFQDWRFVPKQLVDVSHPSLKREIFGKPWAMPLCISPTGLNGLFTHNADTKLARGAAAQGVPFIQSSMSTDAMEDVGKVEGLRHWWQLYVFGGDEVWQELIARADRAGCEALVVTTNSQIYGDREWDSRTRSTRSQPSIPTIFEAAQHPFWLGHTLLTHGMPSFKNIIDFVPKDQRGFFESAYWVRDNQPKSLAWDTIEKIRQRWKKPLVIKGLLHPDDLRRAVDVGADGVALDTHGGRQLDWSVSALDVLPRAREIVGDKLTLFLTGGIRRGTDLLKALSLGADAAFAARAPLYGLCAGGAPGVKRALEILHQETSDAMGLLGAPTLADLGPHLLAHRGGFALPRDGNA